ncbi:L-cysteine desulfidase family protein [Proteocatella sphenisci]|uniref:L-cysteine desulfidase family protein n=1 Tax=Proteocatella sphenisci TaxID=181070 RepID=UPI0004B82859|nr:L-serine ammonia-lyase, iron-sulfur-dependent, subunit alpha [Proteocatella sphenisci]
MFENFIDILKEELVPALGCTEPIAIAYAAAKAKEVLGEMPDSMIVHCSGNIIKNVKGVTVPSTGNMKGIETSAILGALAGDASKELEVLTSVRPDHVAKTRELLAQKICQVSLAKGVENLFIEITAVKGDKSASVTISDSHTNIINIKKDGNTIFEKDSKASSNQKKQDRSNLSVKNIYEFANTVDIEAVKPVLGRQIKCNMEIANEGIQNKYGTAVGRTLLKYDCDEIKTKAKAYTAAGSDARMSGCVLPVVINSGSGNQGMTVSIPVILYAQHIGASEEKLYRALALSNLLGIHQKSGIGKLSAYCGAVSAGCAAGAAIAYLDDQPLSVIEDTITNSLLNVSGIVCDGAKPSCAAKISSSVDAAFMGYHMALEGNRYLPGEGLVGTDIEKTIKNIGLMAKVGMKETDVEILTLMISE